MAPRKINFFGLPADLQNLVISKLAAAEAANLGATSREMRAAVAEPLKKMKRERDMAAEAHAELMRRIPEIISRPYRDPAPQHVMLGKYRVSTTRPTGPAPFYFHATVASDEMSVEFVVWDPDVHFLIPGGQPVIYQTNLTVEGQKKRFVPKLKKYDTIRKNVTDITNSLKRSRMFYL